MPDGSDPSTRLTRDAQQRYDAVIGTRPPNAPDRTRLRLVTRFLPAPQLLEARYHYHAAGQDDQAMTAQRDDYDTAEPLYRRALDISERIGDQAGMSTSYAVLGGLSEARGNLDQAITYP